MNPARLIARKRDGGQLTSSEFQYFIQGFATDRIPDYQMAAMAMAIFLNGMDDEETAAMTEQMLLSGRILDWPAGFCCVDKHSTGGIGDKVSLILAPLLACCDLQVPMISGRGLGPTGGTLDKLESIPGFRTHLSIEEMQAVVQRVGCVINGATDELAPADKKLYALRDVTGTVPSIPLITASILSKKLAEGLDALVLDVKWGNGAFMKSLDQARALADSLVRTGKRLGLSTRAVLTDMNQPLGRMVGNAVEVNESVEALVGAGPDDLREITLRLGIELLMMTRRGDTPEACGERLETALRSGAAMEKFAEMVRAQGGDLSAPRQVAPRSELLADRDGFVVGCDTEALGMAIIELGGGRRLKSDAVDHSVGFEMRVRVGDRVERTTPLANVFAHPHHREAAHHMIRDAIVLGDHPVSPVPLIYE